MTGPYGDDLDDPWIEHEVDRDPCEHDEQYIDRDILTGRAHCSLCGEAWWMSRNEIDAEARFQAEYAEQEGEVNHATGNHER